MKHFMVDWWLHGVPVFGKTTVKSVHWCTWVTHTWQHNRGKGQPPLVSYSSGWSLFSGVRWFLPCVSWCFPVQPPPVLTRQGSTLRSSDYSFVINSVFPLLKEILPVIPLPHQALSHPSSCSWSFLPPPICTIFQSPCSWFVLSPVFSMNCLNWFWSWGWGLLPLIITKVSTADGWRVQRWRN